MRILIALCFMASNIFLCLIANAEEPVGAPEAIVQAWIKASEQRGSFEVTGSQFEYHKIFQIARVSTMHAWANSPTDWKWSWYQKSDTAIGSTIEKRGEKFQLGPLQPCVLEVHAGKFYQCAADQIQEYQVKKFSDLGKRSWFDRLVWEPIASMRPFNWIAFPHLYPNEVAAHRVEIDSTVQLQAESETAVILNFYPTDAVIQKNYRSVRIIFDSMTMLPQAIQVLDPTGNKETVIVLKSLQPVKHTEIKAPDERLTTLEIALRNTAKDTEGQSTDR